MASEFYFDFKKAAIYQAVIWERWPTFRFVKIIRRFFFILFIAFLLIFIFGLFGETLAIKTLSRLLGLSIISLTISLFYWWKELFLNSKLKKPKLKTKLEEVLAKPENYNLAEFLSFESAKAIFNSNNNSTLIFYNLLCQNPKLNFIFSRALLNIKEVKQLLRATRGPASADFQEVVLESLKIAQKKGHLRIEIGDLLTSLAKYDPLFKNILIEANLKKEDIENLTWWLEGLEEKIEEQKKFWQWKNLIKQGSLGKQWAAGYTITLDQFSIDISELVKKRNYPETVGHQKEIEVMERILARREIKNVLIVGESGSGRKSMVEALAVKSVLGESLPEVNFKRVVQLDLASLLAQANTQETAAAILETIFGEVITAGNIILVIDEFHNFITSQMRPGVIDISGLLSRYLALSQFQLVAVTTFEGLHRNIEQNTSILSLFEKVEVSEISERETLILLERLALALEQKYKKFISYPALRDIVKFSGKYFASSPFPEKAVGLLDEAMVYLSRRKEKVLLAADVAKVVSEKTQIPVGGIETKEREILLDLENLIHQRIINQEEAVKEAASALRRARAEVQVRKGPMGTFLFLGPTGVGKTETAKALTEIYFGSELRMIRLDMSEFQNVADIPRLLGSAGQEGLLTTQIREAPFSLILLDEIEKAHPNILNLFLQVLDEGHLTDGLGRKVDFKNSIIIATSNAGAEIIWKDIRENKKMDIIKEDLLNILVEKAIFRPEFLNRFDAVVVFKPLTKENLLKIAELMLQRLKKNLKEKEIEFIITEELKEKIAELGYDPIFGARQMRRVIQDKVENVLAQAILAGELKKRDRVGVNPEEFGLEINR